MIHRSITAIIMPFFEFDGKETKLSVPPKMYAGLSVGSTGRLITEDGKFLDFIINDE